MKITSTNIGLQSRDVYETAKRLSENWQRLCSEYLSVTPPESVWRYHRKPNPGDPQQGWKLHISATVLNAHRVLERVAPLLIERGVQFKAPSSLNTVREINCGMHSSFSQVGKIITVYSRSDEEALFLARKLHSLTRRFVAPVIPFDKRYRKKSNVYYRYGAFSLREITLPDGSVAPAIRNPEGELVPDLYGPGLEKPVWVQDPFQQSSTQKTRAVCNDSPLRSSFRAFRALSQRGKGGVYQAIDFTVNPPRLCLLKEGRRAGELGWDRRDGRWRIKHEQKVISMLHEIGLDVPQQYSSFESNGNYYLVLEFVDGENLHSFLLKRQRRLSIRQVLAYSLQLADFIAQLHAAGWVWRDCKPSNVIVTNKHRLKPLDFEGACRLHKPDALPWITPAFKPPKTQVHQPRAMTTDDLYALGSVTYLLLTGRLPDQEQSPTPAHKLRRNTPPQLSLLIDNLLNPSAHRSLDALSVTRELREIARQYQRESDWQLVEINVPVTRVAAAAG